MTRWERRMKKEEKRKRIKGPWAGDERGKKKEEKKKRRKGPGAGD